MAVQQGGRDFEAPFPPITDEEFRKISLLAYEKAGIRLGPEKKVLVQSRLCKVLRKEGLTSYDEYYCRLIADKTGREFARFIDLITTNFTHFFREKRHFDFLSEQILPEVRESGRVLRIWSAGCATGEEPYSIAILLLEEGFSADEAMVLASDISLQALSEAEEGVYEEEKLRELPPVLKRKYFLPAGGGRYRIKEEVKGLVRFRRSNLLFPPPWGFPLDVIFCRNVMIYFDNENKKRVLWNLRSALRKGGYLFVGHAESLITVSNGTGLKYMRPSIYRRME